MRQVFYSVSGLKRRIEHPRTKLVSCVVAKGSEAEVRTEEVLLQLLNLSSKGHISRDSVFDNIQEPTKVEIRIVGSVLLMMKR
jgi:hypothetical protein